MSIISSLAIFLSCIVYLSTTSTGHAIRVVNNKLPPNTTLFQDVIKKDPSQENTTPKEDHKITPTREKTINSICFNNLHNNHHDHNEVKKHKSHSRSRSRSWPRGSKLVKNKAISWKVPRNKRIPQPPSFNLDYDPPRVHPPTHN